MSMAIREGRKKDLVKKYDDGRTKQSFKDSTDINKLLSRAQREGTLSHLQKHEAVYGDFSDFDFLEAQRMLARGKSIFDELPSEVRREFNQDPREFFAFVNDPKNKDKLKDALPELAAPGRQRIVLNRPDVGGEPEAPSQGADPASGSEPPVVEGDSSGGDAGGDGVSDSSGDGSPP